MEVPIITSVNTGCKEVVLEGVNGFLTAPNDAGMLAARMEEMMVLSVGQRAEMGRRGRERVNEKFGMEKILKEYDVTLSDLKRKA
jgi:glycosyltransferase involved in cell wall biosynthesis